MTETRTFSSTRATANQPPTRALSLCRLVWGSGPPAACVQEPLAWHTGSVEPSPPPAVVRPPYAGPSARALPGAVSSHRRLLSPRPEMGTEVASGLWEEVTVFKGLSFSTRLFNFITFAVCLTRRKCVFILSGGS